MSHRIASGVLIAASIILSFASAIARSDGDGTTENVTLAWSPCPACDGDGHPLAPAVRYELRATLNGGDEKLLVTIVHDTTGTVPIARGVVYRVRVVGYDAEGRASAPGDWSDPIYFRVDDRLGISPESPHLKPAVPNPFNPTTEIAYAVPVDAGTATLAIYDARGVRLRTLPVVPAPGWHAATWNGCDDAGARLPSGTYVAWFKCGSHVATTKLTLVK